jgi:hypothetical protein
MTVEAPVALFHRELDDHVTVAVDGVYGAIPEGDEARDIRPVGRVVVTMPDYVADTLSHLIANAHEIVNRLSNVPSGAAGVDLDGPNLDLSVALYEASRRHGYRCCRRPALHEAAAGACTERGLA